MEVFGGNACQPAKSYYCGVCARCWPLTGGWRGRSQNCAPHMGSGHGWLAGDWPSTGGVLNITAAAWTAGFLWLRSGNKKRTQNMLASTCLYSLYAWLTGCERQDDAVQRYKQPS